MILLLSSKIISLVILLPLLFIDIQADMKCPEIEYAYILLSNGFVRVITVFTVFRLLTDFVCLYIYEFWLSLWKIVRSSVILLLPLFAFVLKIYYILPLITNKYYRNNRIIMIRAFHYLKYFSVKKPQKIGTIIRSSIYLNFFLVRVL
jgi:hypothetical protein